MSSRMDKLMFHAAAQSVTRTPRYATHVVWFKYPSLCFDTGILRRNSSNLTVRSELVTLVNRQGTTHTRFIWPIEKSGKRL
jgi:hypothetical protein